ncbi:cytosolic protein, partial [Bacillus thuringiensis]|nr:cytosolic protein [Bacillus thuringiensis]
PQPSPIRKTSQKIPHFLAIVNVYKQLEMKRKSDMRQTSNIIIIQPIITEEQLVTEAPTKTVEICHTKKTTTKTLKQKIKDINKRKEEVSQSFQHDLDFIDYRVP